MDLETWRTFGDSFPPDKNTKSSKSSTNGLMSQGIDTPEQAQLKSTYILEKTMTTLVHTSYASLWSDKGIKTQHCTCSCWEFGKYSLPCSFTLASNREWKHSHPVYIIRVRIAKRSKEQLWTARRQLSRSCF